MVGRIAASNSTTVCRQQRRKFRKISRKLGIGIIEQQQVRVVVCLCLCLGACVRFWNWPLFLFQRGWGCWGRVAVAESRWLLLGLCLGRRVDVGSGSSINISISGSISSGFVRWGLRWLWFERDGVLFDAEELAEDRGVVDVVERLRCVSSSVVVVVVVVEEEEEVLANGYVGWITDQRLLVICGSARNNWNWGSYSSKREGGTEAL